MNTKDCDTQTRRKRLLWRCRRGTLELDTLLRDFVEQQYANFSEAELKVLDDLLDRPHADLQRWLVMGEKASEPSIAAIVRRFQNHRSSITSGTTSD